MKMIIDREKFNFDSKELFKKILNYLISETEFNFIKQNAPKNIHSI